MYSKMLPNFFQKAKDYFVGSFILEEHIAAFATYSVQVKITKLWVPLIMGALGYRIWMHMDILISYVDI